MPADGKWDLIRRLRGEGFYLLPLIGTMSSHTRHGFPLYRVHCRTDIENLLRVLCWFYPELRCLVSAFVLEDQGFSVKLIWTGIFWN